MKQRIQEIIDKHIQSKIEYINNLKNEIDYRDKKLAIIVDNKNVDSPYVKAIQRTFNKYLSEDNIKFIYLKEGMEEGDIFISLFSQIDIYSELNGYISIQPSTLNLNGIFLGYGEDLDAVNNYCNFKDKDSLPITSKVIADIIEEFVQYIDRPNIVVLGNGVTVGKPITLWCQHNPKWNVYQIKSCFKEDMTKRESLRELLLEEADLIISATGKPQILCIKDKSIISPTIAHEVITNTYVSDLHREYAPHCDTNKVLNSIGTLTNLELCIRWLLNLKNRDEGW